MNILLNQRLIIFMFSIWTFSHNYLHTYFHFLYTEEHYQRSPSYHLSLSSDEYFIHLSKMSLLFYFFCVLFLFMFLQSHTVLLIFSTFLSLLNAFLRGFFLEWHCLLLKPWLSFFFSGLSFYWRDFFFPCLAVFFLAWLPDHSRLTVNFLFVLLD